MPKRGTKPTSFTCRVTWSEEDEEYVGLCAEFPSLSWLAASPEEVLAGIRAVGAEAVADMQANGETAPEPITTRRYSGRFMVLGLWTIVALTETGSNLDK